MRKQLISAMLALVLLLLPVSLWLQIRESFSLSLSGARESTLREETAIARALKEEIGTGATQEKIWQTAQTAQGKYGSDRLKILFYEGRTPMNGNTLPEEVLSSGLLGVSARTTYLSSREEVMYVARPLTDRVRLVLASDYSGLYEMRRQQAVYAVWICLAGIALALVLSLLIAGRLTKALRRLAGWAEEIRGGTAAPEHGRSGNEISRLTGAFIDMRAAVEQREEALRDQAGRRQQLIDALAHEMRTPLTAIVSAARLAQDCPDEQARREMCDLIAQESKRLSDMDEDLMRLTRMNGEGPDLSDFSLEEMAAEALAPFPEAVLEGEGGRVRADRALLVHLLRNLVKNAQASGSPSPVRVTLRPGGFTVSDEGRGMSEEEVARCAEPFWKADPARTRKSGGAGLGLAICRQIAALHGADLAIRSEPGKGTSVEFTLPLHPGEDSETAGAVSCEGRRDEHEESCEP